MARRLAGYAARPTQDHPMVVIPRAIFARITIASEEIGETEEKCVELAMREWLDRHGQRMDDEAFERACRQAEIDMRASPTRHEFDRHRPKRKTEPK